MSRLKTQQRPVPGQLWLSRPPFLLLAHVTDVREEEYPPRISYELIDDDGSILDGAVDAPLDAGWWHVFQPLVRRWG